MIISETAGPARRKFYGRNRRPSAYLYFLSAMEWSKREGVEMFYFSSFDES